MRYALSTYHNKRQIFSKLKKQFSKPRADPVKNKQTSIKTIQGVAKTSHGVFAVFFATSWNVNVKLFGGSIERSFQSD